MPYHCLPADTHKAFRPCTLMCAETSVKNTLILNLYSNRKNLHKFMYMGLLCHI